MNCIPYKQNISYIFLNVHSISREHMQTVFPGANLYADSYVARYSTRSVADIEITKAGEFFLVIYKILQIKIGTVCTKKHKLNVITLAMKTKRHVYNRALQDAISCPAVAIFKRF